MFSVQVVQRQPLGRWREGGLERGWGHRGLEPKHRLLTEQDDLKDCLTPPPVH